MANRPALITKADATRLFKAAKDAGYDRARFMTYPDGRTEVVVEAFRPIATDAASDWDDILDAPESA